MIYFEAKMPMSGQPLSLTDIFRIELKLFMPYFSAAAMRYIVERCTQHLLVDMPSIDKMHDDGKLENHHWLKIWFKSWIMN